jgi:uncharacterized membrane protein
MSDNPFQTPISAKQRSEENLEQYRHDGSGRTFVRQVDVISILMIVQGVFLLLFALFCLGYAIFFGNMDSFLPEKERAEFERQLPPDSRTMMIIMFGAWGGLTAMLAILHVVTACFNLALRARTLGIVTLLLGIGSAMTCYCAITGIPLSIYGLIIYFNPATAEAFRLRKSGMSKPEVLATFVR